MSVSVKTTKEYTIVLGEQAANALFTILWTKLSGSGPGRLALDQLSEDLSGAGAQAMDFLFTGCLTAASALDEN